MDSKADVMVDVAPNIIVFRKDGKWDWKGPPGISKEAVMRELAFQAQRMHLKRALLQEALEGLSDT